MLAETQTSVLQGSVSVQTLLSTTQLGLIVHKAKIQEMAWLSSSEISSRIPFVLGPS